MIGGWGKVPSQGAFQQSASQKTYPWIQNKETHHDDFILKLHTEIHDFANWISPTPQEKHARLLVAYKLRMLISSLWPDAKVLSIGSSATFTNLPDGDIDISVHNAPNYGYILEELNNYLSSCNFFIESEVIPARCPIIKGVEKQFKFKIDISVNNENGVLNIKRTRSYFTKYPTLVPTLMVLKYYICMYHLDEPYTGGISTNTLVQMVIFSIQSTNEKDQWNCGNVILNFFEIFGRTFNYVTTGFSTREGGRTFSKVNRFLMNWESPFTLCVEDPQAPGNFLGENALQAINLRKIFDKAYQSLKFRTQQKDESLLGKIINPSSPFFSQMESRRNEINNLYHRFVGIESVKLT